MVELIAIRSNPTQQHKQNQKIIIDLSFLILIKKSYETYSVVENLIISIF